MASPHALAALLALAAASTAAPAPASYDQRQDGDFNVQADVQNVVILAVIPGKVLSPLDLLGALKTSAADRRSGGGGGGGGREGFDVLEAFVEPGTPYRVDVDGAVGGGESSAEADEEVVAPAPAEPLLLLGALEQCGPGRARDTEGICRDIAAPAASPAAATTAPAPSPAATAAAAASER